MAAKITFYETFPTRSSQTERWRIHRAKEKSTYIRAFNQYLAANAAAAAATANAAAAAAVAVAALAAAAAAAAVTVCADAVAVVAAAVATPGFG